ncbi:copper homeostasis protein CutC [Sphingomonas crusticola]|uniref:copper homeostasis protein CutC n=1 Tax=Sphingomonas crusticola TaxID=1697973 RepID=UPI000E27F3B6|nr:copper homeostasis protein CutC [Sphingomonas crusticola]
MAVLLEICVDDAAGVEAAVAGGADRIELCSALELGGLTPPPALLRCAVASGLPIHAMIRPRSGGFLLKDGDVALMIDEIGSALAEGATGVVVGALLADGTLNQAALGAFRDAAGDAQIVLHRAIDLTPDPVAAVESACALGYDKILSSGGATTAIEGAATLARMVSAAKGRLSIIAGSGVTPDNVALLLTQTGVLEVHSSASVADAPPDEAALRLGFAMGARRVTDAGTVRRLCAAIERNSTSRARETTG